MVTETDRQVFHTSTAHSVARLLLIPLLGFSVWSIYSRGDLLMAAILGIGLAVYAYGVLREHGKPLFVFGPGVLRVRGGLGANFDIPLSDITLVDNSPWIGMKVVAAGKTHRLFVDQLSGEDRASFKAMLKERTGLDFAA